MINFDDLDDGLKAAPIRGGVSLDRAHIVNGGQTTQALVDCPKCAGSGQWRGGYAVRRCFRCDGKGQITVRSAAATKAKATRDANERDAMAAFLRDSAEVVAFLRENGSWSAFFKSMYEQILDGRVLSERQLASVQSAMAKIAATRAAKASARNASAPSVDVSAIEALFATARANGKKRKLELLAHGVSFKPAPANGKNPGAVYAFADGEYQGKIADGKFLAVASAKGETKARVLAVAADPLTEFVQYGKDTGICSCCGAELENEVSKALGIGPVCRKKWGL